jgi:lipoprotein NlpI
MDWLWAGNGRFYDYEVDTALEAWGQALVLDPELCLAFANRAYALRLVGRRELAHLDAKRALECAPENVEYRAAVELLTKLSGARAQ